MFFYVAVEASDHRRAFHYGPNHLVMIVVVVIRCNPINCAKSSRI
jgi:hypothetical protein